MINSVSGVSFRGDVAPAQNMQDLINAPGQYTTQVADAPADSFEKEGGEKKKSKAPAIIGTLVALAAAAYVGLGIAVGKGKLEKVVAAEGAELKFADKAKNVLCDIGENAKGVWNSVKGLFGKKEAAEGKAAAEGAEKAAEGAEKAAGGAGEVKPETPKTDA